MVDLLQRVVPPSRLSLIVRGEQTAAYNPGENVWHIVDELTAEVLRWLRAERDREDLCQHLSRRFALTSDKARDQLQELLRWCILRRLLYLDVEPVLPTLAFPSNPLTSVYWICTQACNLRCTYCYQEALIARPSELSTIEAIDLVDQVVEAGAQTLVFTGGEPFSRRDLLRIALHSKERGLMTNVITNGHFITRRNIATISQTFDLVTVSLDHMRPEHHDRHRGERSWLRAKNAINLLLEAGVQVDVNSVLSRSGISDIEGLLRIQTLGITQHNITARFPMGRGSLENNDDLTPQDLLGLSDRLVVSQQTMHNAQDTVEGRGRVRREGDYSRKGLRRQHCGAGLSEVSVDPEGWVYPCKLLQYSQYKGENIRVKRLKDVYANGSVMQEARRQIADNLIPCKTCIIKNYCGGGCRGIHASFSESHDGTNPLFCAYLRRSFEAGVWQRSDIPLAPRRDDFNESGRRMLPIEPV
jgi:radical SAM protein with 4Fe4S-binding SPASM domain